MKLKHAVPCLFDVCQSQSKKYHDAEGNTTNENIAFLSFDEDVNVEGLSANFAVCSRAVAGKLSSCKNDAERIAFLANCTIEVNDQGEEPQLAVKMPNSSKRLASGLHF